MDNNQRLLQILDELFNDDPNADDELLLEKLQNLLQNTQLLSLRLNEVITHGFNKGKTPLYCFMILAMQKCPGPLMTLFSYGSPSCLKKLNFAFKPQGEEESIIDLFIMYVSLDWNEDNLRMLGQFLKHADLSTIDFNVELSKTRQKEEMVTAEVKILEDAFASLEINENKSQDQKPTPCRQMTRLSVIATVAAMEQRSEFLNDIFAVIDPCMLDFNADNSAALWWIATLALKGHETPLRTILKKVPIGALEFDISPSDDTPYSGKSTSNLLERTKWKEVILFLKHLEEAKQIYQSKNTKHLYSYLKFVLELAEKAAANGETFVFHQLAIFYLEIRDFKRFKETIVRLSSNDELVEQAFHDLFKLTKQLHRQGNIELFEYAVDAFPETNRYHDQAIFLYVNFLMNPDGMQNLSILSPEEQKTQENLLMKAFKYSLKMTSSDSQDIRKTIAINYAYNVDTHVKKEKLLPSENKHDELLDHIKGDEQTCVFALKLLRRHVQAKKALNSLNVAPVQPIKPGNILHRRTKSN